MNGNWEFNFMIWRRRMKVSILFTFELPICDSFRRQATNVRFVEFTNIYHPFCRVENFFRTKEFFFSFFPLLLYPCFHNLLVPQIILINLDLTDTFHKSRAFSLLLILELVTGKKKKSTFI